MATITDAEPVYTPREVAEHLRVGYRTVLNLITSGRIRAVPMFGGMYRVPRSALTEYLASAGAPGALVASGRALREAPAE